MAETSIDTGLVAASVNQPAAEPVVPVTYPVVLPQQLTAQTLAKLARELVQAIRDPLKVYAEYGLTEERFNTEIKANDFFRRAFKSYTIEWNSADSTAARLRLQSQAIMEENLPGFGARMADAKENLPAVVQAATLIAKMGGVGEDKQQVHPGERFTITINLGADTQQFNKTIGPTIDLEATPVLENSNEKLSAKSNPV